MERLQIQGESFFPLSAQPSMSSLLTNPKQSGHLRSGTPSYLLDDPGFRCGTFDSKTALFLQPT